MEVDARIVVIHQETPTVRSFLLDLGGENLSFRSGQYVDLIIDSPLGFETGGFSITSSPLMEGVVQVAVKKLMERPASIFLHEQAQVGDLVMLMGPSGEFYYERGMASSIVLVAGGIGITPLVSMLRYVDEGNLEVRVTLIYSAKTPSELLFREELEAIAARNERIRCLFTVTQPGDEPWQGRVGRIDKDMLEEAAADKDALFYLCGPTGMPAHVNSILVAQGVERSRVKSEQW